MMSAETSSCQQHEKSDNTPSTYICGKIQSCIHEMIQVPCFTHEVTTYWWDESYSDCKQSCPRVWGLWAWRFQSNSVGWTGSAGTEAKQMLGINQSHWHGASHQVTSRSVPISYQLIKMYGRQTEAIRADAKVKSIQCLESYCTLGLRNPSGIVEDMLFLISTWWRAWAFLTASCLWKPQEWTLFAKRHVL